VVQEVTEDELQYDPAGQSVHAVAPPMEYSPAVHATLELGVAQ
jgi:hypothetical protein